MAEDERTDSVSPEPANVPAPPTGTTPGHTPAIDEETLVLRVVERLVGGLGLRVRLEIEKRHDGYHVNVLTRRATAILIGHRGATLKAIQYLARLIVRKTHAEVPPVFVDVGGYAERRDTMLRQKATAVARIVLDTGRQMALDMLTEKEMHLVREALSSLPGVRVYAVGEGMHRNVIIAPVRQADPTAER